MKFGDGKRAAVAAGLCLFAAGAMAETYVAKVYGSPPGYAWMLVEGAGDNGMMTGYLRHPSNENHAAYFTPQGFKDLHPGGFVASEILDSWGGTYHCGVGRTASETHALFWVGGGAAVSLHPASGYHGSYAVGGNGNQQAGQVNTNIPCATPQCGVGTGAHASVWTRTAASMRKLHVSVSFDSCRAMSTDGVQQGGSAGTVAGGNSRAMLWNGPNTFGVNIHPSGCTYSEVRSNWGPEQGGVMYGVVTGSQEHAAYWRGTAQSCVDLHPSPFERSEVTAVRNGLQVGFGHAPTPVGNGRDQAIAWHGSAASWINLHFKLPSMYWTWHSFASDIDNLGNITGWVQNSDGSVRRPVIWERQP